MSKKWYLNYEYAFFKNVMENMISRIQELGLCKIQQTNKLYPYSK